MNTLTGGEQSNNEFFIESNNMVDPLGRVVEKSYTRDGTFNYPAEKTGLPFVSDTTQSTPLTAKPLPQVEPASTQTGFVSGINQLTLDYLTTKASPRHTQTWAQLLGLVSKA